jgi:hypothetical protein
VLPPFRRAIDGGPFRPYRVRGRPWASPLMILPGVPHIQWAGRKRGAILD